MTGIVGLGLLFHAGAPPAVRPKSGEVESLPERIKGAQSASTANGAHVLRIDESDVNSYFDSELALERSRSETAQIGTRKAPSDSHTALKDLRLNLRDDKMHIYLLLKIRDEDITVDLEGKLYSQGSYMRFEPLNGKIGALPLPQPMLARIVQVIMDSPDQRESMRLPPGIADLRVENSQFVLTYR